MSVRSSLFIDWLSLTLPIRPSLHRSVKGELELLCTEGELEHVSDQYSELRKGYRFAYRLMFDDDLFCAIQIEPFNPGTRFMRLEWNPASAQRVCGNAIQRMMHVLARCTSGNPLQLIARANITRIDLTFDLHRVSLDSFLVHTTLRKNYSGQYFQLHEEFHPTGKLNARYIGKPDGERHLLMYDKRLQVKMQQIRKNPTRRMDDRGRSAIKRIVPTRTRFELRLRKVGSWEKLFELPNPFEKYTVIACKNLGGIAHDHHMRFFISACQTWGAQSALSVIKNTRERKKYADALKVCDPPSWWNPELIRAELPKAIARAIWFEIPS